MFVGGYLIKSKQVTGGLNRDIQIQFSDPNPETSISQSESKYNSNNLEF